MKQWELFAFGIQYSVNVKISQSKYNNRDKGSHNVFQIKYTRWLKLPGIGFILKCPFL